MEIWKDVKGYEGLYQVSNLGKLKSLKRQYAMERIVNPIRNRMYLYYQLWRGGKKKGFRLHRLVAIAFIPNPNNLSEINHIDGDKLNNSIVNLEWTSRAINAKHASANGLYKIGERHHATKFKTEDIIKIRKSDKTNAELSRIYNVTPEAISSIRRRVNWKHVA